MRKGWKKEKWYYLYVQCSPGGKMELIGWTPEKKRAKEMLAFYVERHVKTKIVRKTPEW